MSYKSILAMNEETWISLQEKMVDDALKKPNPISHLNMLNRLEIIIDDDIEDNVVEAYDSMEMYEYMKELKEEEDEGFYF